eukprot:scaffold1363_cov144-Isochrysis_galbana.AAC.3
MTGVTPHFFFTPTASPAGVLPTTRWPPCAAALKRPAAPSCHRSLHSTARTKARVGHVATEKLRDERGSGCGWGLYWPPPARPAAPHASKSRHPASSSADVAIGNLRRAPADINRAPVPSTGSPRHAGLRPGAGNVAPAATRRHPRGQPLPTPPNRTSPPRTAPTWPSATFAARQLE